MLTALLPLNRLDRVKSRLGLDLAPRSQLAVEMARRVLGALAQVSAIDRVVLVSPDPTLRALHPHFSLQPGIGLNQDLEAARARAPGSLLVVLPDLPNLRKAEVAAMLRRPEPVVVASDRAGRGTNLLLLRQPIPFRFGPDSCWRHLAEASRAGLQSFVFRSPGTEFDLDEPTDLHRYTFDTVGIHRG